MLVTDGSREALLVSETATEWQITLDGRPAASYNKSHLRYSKSRLGRISELWDGKNRNLAGAHWSVVEAWEVVIEWCKRPENKAFAKYAIKSHVMFSATGEVTTFRQQQDRNPKHYNLGVQLACLRYARLIEDYEFECCILAEIDYAWTFMEPADGYHKATVDDLKHITVDHIRQALAMAPMVDAFLYSWVYVTIFAADIEDICYHVYNVSYWNLHQKDWVAAQPRFKLKLGSELSTSDEGIPGSNAGGPPESNENPGTSLSSQPAGMAAPSGGFPPSVRLPQMNVSNELPAAPAGASVAPAPSKGSITPTAAQDFTKTYLPLYASDIEEVPPKEPKTSTHPWRSLPSYSDRAAPSAPSTAPSRAAQMNYSTKLSTAPVPILPAPNPLKRSAKPTADQTAKSGPLYVSESEGEVVSSKRRKMAITEDIPDKPIETVAERVKSRAAKGQSKEKDRKKTARLRNAARDKKRQIEDEEDEGEIT